MVLRYSQQSRVTATPSTTLVAGPSVQTAGEVVVDVKAAALNFPDLLMTQGGYQFKPDLPFTSGLEFAGEVLEADPASGFAPGDRVMGGNKTGAFAEIASVPADRLSPMPNGMDFPAAAAMGAAYSTAFTGLVELGGLQEDQWVLVHGASGGVGLATCDLARALQAKIGRARDQLLTFCDFPGEVEVTNNGSERKLRPCVIQRKVTNGYRAMWAAKAEADVRTTIDTARLKGANPFDVILATLA